MDLFFASATQNFTKKIFGNKSDLLRKNVPDSKIDEVLDYENDNISGKVQGFFTALSFVIKNDFLKIYRCSLRIEMKGF